MEKDEQKIKGLNGASLKMWVVANGNTAAPPLSTSPSPIKTAFVNLMTIPGSRLRSSVGEKFAATVLLENPVGENFLTYEELVQEATTLMKVYIRHKIHFYVRRNSSESGATLVPVEANLMEYTGQTLFMSEEELDTSSLSSVRLPPAPSGHVASVPQGAMPQYF